MARPTTVYRVTEVRFVRVVVTHDVVAHDLNDAFVRAREGDSYASEVERTDFASGFGLHPDDADESACWKLATRLEEPPATPTPAAPKALPADAYPSDDDEEHRRFTCDCC